MPMRRDRAASEHVEDAADARAPASSMKLAQRRTVDARNRQVGAEAIDDQKTKGEKDTLAQIGGFAEARPARVGGHLFCG